MFPEKLYGKLAPPIPRKPLGSDECTCPACVGLPVVLSPPTVPSPQDQRRIVIAFTGKAGAGKSTCADHLIAKHGFQRIKFASALKAMLRTFLAYRGASPNVIKEMIEGSWKETPSPFLNDRTPRHAMQTLGTQWGRECLHPDIWVDTERDHLPPFGRFVCDDCRFPNEADMVRATGGKIVQVLRRGLAQGTHESETHALKADYFMMNTGTIADLQRDVDGFLLVDMGCAN